MYEIIEKNQYGVLVKNTTNYGDCFFCKYEITQCNNRYKCINDSYYIPDSEAEKLESENPLMNTTIEDLYIESKCYFKVKKKLDDTQKELIYLSCKLRVEEEKSKALIKYLEYQINSSRCDELNTCSLADIQFYKGKNTAFNHVLNFIKNQK